MKYLNSASKYTAHFKRKNRKTTLETPLRPIQKIIEKLISENAPSIGAHRDFLSLLDQPLAGRREGDITTNFTVLTDHDHDKTRQIILYRATATLWRQQN